MLTVLMATTAFQAPAIFVQEEPTVPMESQPLPSVPLPLIMTKKECIAQPTVFLVQLGISANKMVWVIWTSRMTQASTNSDASLATIVWSELPFKFLVLLPNIGQFPCLVPLMNLVSIVPVATTVLKAQVIQFLVKITNTAMVRLNPYLVLLANNA